jgi:hypothetical protein
VVQPSTQLKLNLQGGDCAALRKLKKLELRCNCNSNMSYVSRKHAGRSLDTPSTNKMHQARNGGTTLNLPPSPTQSIVACHSMNNLDTSSKGKGPLAQDLDRGTPGDAQFFSTNKAPRWNELSKKKSQFYDDAFACREPNSSARERVLRESVVMAEIRTNVIVCIISRAHERSVC